MYSVNKGVSKEGNFYIKKPQIDKIRHLNP